MPRIGNIFTSTNMINAFNLLKVKLNTCFFLSIMNKLTSGKWSETAVVKDTGMTEALTE